MWEGGVVLDDEPVVERDRYGSTETKRYADSSQRNGHWVDTVSVAIMSRGVIVHTGRPDISSDHFLVDFQT